jgi:hypothetical protein
MGSRFKEHFADMPAGSPFLMAFGAFICLTLSISAILALALSIKAFLIP